jgi:uncharacterized protein (TIGR02266 family)
VLDGDFRADCPPSTTLRILALADHRIVRSARCDKLLRPTRCRCPYGYVPTCESIAGTRENRRALARNAGRHHERVQIELDVTLLSDSNFYAGLTENLSHGGLFIATHMAKPLGSEVEITLTLPTREEPIRAHGMVRWLREFSETSDAPPGMGVQFETLAAEDVTLIEEFLTKRAPLFFEGE